MKLFFPEMYSRVMIQQTMLRLALGLTEYLQCLQLADIINICDVCSCISSCCRVLRAHSLGREFCQQVWAWLSVQDACHSLSCNSVRLCQHFWVGTVKLSLQQSMMFFSTSGLLGTNLHQQDRRVCSLMWKSLQGLHEQSCLDHSGQLFLQDSVGKLFRGSCSEYPVILWNVGRWVGGR